MLTSGIKETLSDYLFEQPLNNISRPQLEENINYINNSFMSQGYPSIGDLFTCDLEEIKKTVDFLYYVLQQRQKDLNFKSQVQDRIQKLESEKNMYQQKIEQLNEDKNALNSEAGKAYNKVLQEAGKLRKEKDKIAAERDDFKKEITKFISKESKMWHEIKKKETLTEKMKEQLRKALGDKDLVYLNHIDVTQNLHNQVTKSLKSDQEFSQLISHGYDESQNSLLNENQELRSALETIQKELHLLMDERKELIMQNMDRMPNINLIHINSQIFQIPFQSVSEDLIETFTENIRRFRQFMQLTSNIMFFKS
jgi:synovial sarcoma, X breakpoint 2 interacting protein